MSWWMEWLSTVFTASLVILATGLGAGWAVIYNKLSYSLMWNKGIISEDDLAMGVRITEDDMPSDETCDEDWLLPRLETKIDTNLKSVLYPESPGFWRSRTNSSINVSK